MSWQLCFWEPYRLTAFGTCSQSVSTHLLTNHGLYGHPLLNFGDQPPGLRELGTNLDLPEIREFPFLSYLLGVRSCSATRLPANLAGSHHVKGWLPFIWYHLSCPWAWWWDKTTVPSTAHTPDFWTINSMFKSCYKRKPSKFHGVQHLPAKFQKHLHYAWAKKS